MLHTYIFLLALCFSNLFGGSATISWHTPEKHASIYITINLEQDDALYKEYMEFYSDHDDVIITQWSADTNPISIYDNIFKETKKVYPSSTTFKIDLTLTHWIPKIHIHCIYYRKHKGSPEEQVFTFEVAKNKSSQTIDHQNIATTQEYVENTPSLIQEAPTQTTSWSCTISQLIEHTHSIWLQCLLILLLGALLSLTPCIYPMIPITVGILQGQGSKSVWKNFLLSICYTSGVATTFATLGIIAAYTGKLFGSFMQHPLVIIGIVALLIYLAGSMFGLYEMHVPSFMSSGNAYTKGGSPTTAFLFGAVSGTVASPCVSPGLALVLSLATKLANPLLGFVMLFVFGVGLSLPLLIIGTFSSSLSLLPQAGFWMVEIKKMFGFLLLAMSIYFLSTLLPMVISIELLALLLCTSGIYYLYTNTPGTYIKRQTHNTIGILLVASALITGYIGLRTFMYPETCSIIGLWIDNYACARAQAQHENKPLLLKVEAPCCSMCTAIDKKFFKKREITDVLSNHYVSVVIDGAEYNEQVQTLIQQYAIAGFPTILIINPHNEQVLKQWTSNLYAYSVEELLIELQHITL